MWRSVLFSVEAQVVVELGCFVGYIAEEIRSVAAAAAAAALLDSCEVPDQVH